MKIVIGSDHAGKEQREEIKKYLEEKGIRVQDCGTFKDTANYVTEGIKVGENIAQGNGDLGIVLCGTGIGISIATNKVCGVRCALVTDPKMAVLAKEHNDANVLALGARIKTLEENIEIINSFLMSKFLEGRHKSRILSLEDYEEGCQC